MANVRCRKDTGLLLLDFRYMGQRCREQTSLPDTPTNRRNETSKGQTDNSYGLHGCIRKGLG